MYEYHHLIKFHHKSSARYLLRKLGSQLISYSSIFKNIEIAHNGTDATPKIKAKDLYLLLRIRDKNFDLVDFVSRLNICVEVVHNQNNPTNQLSITDNQTNLAVIDTLFRWAYYEITHSFEFVKIENHTTLINTEFRQDNLIEYNHGRQLIIKNNSYNSLLIRTFEYLPEVFGIINYTEDSFSGDGLRYKEDLIGNHVMDYLKNNVSIIDLGVESTRPNATKLTANEEISQLKMVLLILLDIKKNYNNTFQISIDTYHQETMYYLNDTSVDIINDVSGNTPSNVVQDLVMNGKKYLAMHSLGVPADKNKIIDIEDDPVEKIYLWMQKKLDNLINQCNLPTSSIILDTGIGFGNNQTQAWYIINKLDKFRELPCEILLGHSRKSFLSYINNNKFDVIERDLDTAVVALGVMPHVDYLRLHNVSLLNRIYSVNANF